MSFNMDAEVKNRVAELRKYMEEKKIDASIVVEPDNQYYLTGFRAIIYSRPIVTVITADDVDVIVPDLEREHANEKALADKIHVYYETVYYEGKEISYLEHLDKVLSKLSKHAVIGVEYNAMPVELFKYLTSKFSNEIADVGEKIKQMRFTKDAQEIKLLVEAGKLSDIALAESMRHARAGISELEFDVLGDKKLLEEAAKNYKEDIVGFANWTCSGPIRSAMPHLYSSTRKFEDGDVVVHSRQVWLNGYRAENERTFIIGKPTDQQLELFKLAVEAQQVAMDIIRPGITAKEVDLASFEVFDKAGYGEYVDHRVGHGLGLSEHEEPYLRFDSDLVLEEGMVYTIEPGVYIPGVGGFRHSDTVILTKDGSFSITQYTRKVEDLIFD